MSLAIEPSPPRHAPHRPATDRGRPRRGTRQIMVTATGLQGVAPSLATLEHAAALGAGWVSVEVRRTADEQPVLLRCSDLRGVSDVSLCYPTRPSVCIEDLTWSEAAQVGIWLGRHATGRVMGLGQLVAGFRGSPGLLLDLPVGPRNTDLDRCVTPHLQRVDRSRPLAVRSRDLDALSRIAAATSDVLTVARLGASAARYSLGLLPADIAAVSVPSDLVDADLVDEARFRGLGVIAEEPTAEEPARRLLELDVLALEVRDEVLLSALLGPRREGRGGQ